MYWLLLLLLSLLLMLLLLISYSYIELNWIYMASNPSVFLPSFLPTVFIPFSFSSGNWTGVNISEMTVMYDWYDSLLSHHHLLLLLLLPLLLELLVQPSSSSPSSSVIITTIYFVSDLLPPELRHSCTSFLVFLIPSVCLSVCLPLPRFLFFLPFSVMFAVFWSWSCRVGVSRGSRYCWMLTVDCWCHYERIICFCIPLFCLSGSVG